jgi:diguanylate cyclase (GGDEF)-like protein
VDPRNDAADGLAAVVALARAAIDVLDQGDPASGPGLLAEAVALFTRHADDEAGTVAAAASLADALRRWGAARAASEFTSLARTLASRTGSVLDETAAGIVGSGIVESGTVEPGTVESGIVESGIVDARLDALGSHLVEQARAVRPAPEVPSGGHDPLTGLAGRLALDRHLVAVAAEAVGTGLVVVALDIDGLGAIDEVFGRAVGDDVVCVVADRVAGLVRAGDLAVRLVADEFVAVLAGPGVAHALEAAERLRAAVAGHPWDDLAAGLRVTVSVGVAAGPRAEGRRLLHAARAACRAAERAGRDRVQLAG